MRTIKNFKQARKALSKFVRPSPGVRYTPERMYSLMGYLNNPQNSLKVIHVAGTSGKTSTSYYTAALLHEAGYTVGLTVSPHVDEINERAQINLSPLPEKEYCGWLSQFLDIVDKSGFELSYFEIMMAFAFWLFNKMKVDYAVVEVGCGGLLDGTNVIDRDDKVCIITDIGFDHTDLLGKTLDKIASQKAGIIKPKNAVFTYQQSKEVTDVIMKKSKDVNADLHIIDSPLQTDSNLPALFQQRNFNLALNAIEYVIKRDNGNKLTKEILRNASNVYIPARMEIISYHNKKIILDGSHNEQKIGGLVDSIQQKFPTTSMAILVSFGAKKQTSVLPSLKLLRQLSTTIIITRFDKGQDEVGDSIDPEELALHAKEAGFETIIIEPKPLKALRLLVKNEAEIGLITGSFYLLNHIRPIVIK